MKTYALITAIEPNRKDINTLKQNYVREYETEAIKCFNEWRKKGGWLKDIPIYCLCPTKVDISDKTKEIFKTLNIQYIHHFFEETLEYKNGYWNIPLTGKYFEQTLDVDYIIKIDLDMYLLKPLPEDLFIGVNEDKTLVGRYDDKSAKHNLNSLFFPKKYGNPFDTGFIISSPNSKFYDKFYNTLAQLTIDFNLSIKKNDQSFYNKYGIKVKGDVEDGMDYGVIEEFSVNLLNYLYPKKIIGISKYNIGEYYIGLDNYSDIELDNIYFLHEHIPYTEAEYNGLKLLIEYKKRLLLYKKCIK